MRRYYTIAARLATPYTESRHAQQEGTMTIEVAKEELRLMLGKVEIASHEDLQGTWSEAQYLKITNSARQLIEFTDGNIEVLPMPTDYHQMIIAYLYRQLFAFLAPLGGIVLFSALRVQMRTGKYREPDLVVLRDAKDPRRQNRYWLGADLAIEVVSEDDPERDTVTKRADYAEAAIPEYWIVNPLDETVTVLALAEGSYIEHGIFQRNERASSALLAGFSVAVSEVFEAA
jgi:Uma2 family endonuclease